MAKLSGKAMFQKIAESKQNARNALSTYSGYAEKDKKQKHNEYK